MANLWHIQRLLNNDANYRSRFLTDPVAALLEHGLVLSPEMQMQLRRMVSQLQTASPRTAGAAFSAAKPGLGLKEWGPAGPGLGLKEWGPAGPGSVKGLPLIIFFE